MLPDFKTYKVRVSTQSDTGIKIDLQFNGIESPEINLSSVVNWFLRAPRPISGKGIVFSTNDLEVTRYPHVKKWRQTIQFSLVIQLCPTLWPHGLQHTRPPCPSPTPGAYSYPCPLMVMQSNYLILCRPLLLLPSVFFPASESFPISQFFASCGQSIGASASASELSMNIKDWFPWG